MRIYPIAFIAALAACFGAQTLANQLEHRGKDIACD